MACYVDVDSVDFNIDFDEVICIFIMLIVMLENWLFVMRLNCKLEIVKIDQEAEQDDTHSLASLRIHSRNGKNHVWTFGLVGLVW